MVSREPGTLSAQEMLVAIIFLLLLLLFSEFQTNIFSDCGMGVSEEWLAVTITA